MPDLIQVSVPDIGDYQDVPVIELLVTEGESVVKDQTLLVLESDKSTLEVPSPSDGVVRGLKVKVGDKVSKGDAICGLEAGSLPTSDTVSSAPAIAVNVAADASIVNGPSPTAPVTVAAAPPSSTISVSVPDIGDFQDVPVIELLVGVGDTVVKDQALVVLESEKSTMEVPSPGEGRVTRLMVKLGDLVSKGTALLELASAGSDAVPAAAAAPEKAATIQAAPPAVKTIESDRASKPEIVSAPDAGSGTHAGPGTRKFARELGVDLSKVRGSAPKGRVVMQDVQEFVKHHINLAPAAAPRTGETASGIPPIPAQDFSLYGEIDTKPLARIRKLSAAHLHRAWVNIPHVTQTDEADITELEVFRKAASEEGVKLTLLPFIMKAVSVAIRHHPEFGSSLSPDGSSLIFKKYCHIGFAADTPNGLVVPVVRDVWSKSITALALETADLAKKARDGKLKPDEMKGGCFSISSLGGIGGSHFTPIVNAPEVGILGVSRGAIKPVWDGKAFQPRLMVPLSLSYDHRVIDGAYAARFIVALVRLLADMRRLSL